MIVGQITFFSTAGPRGTNIFWGCGQGGELRHFYPLGGGLGFFFTKQAKKLHKRPKNQFAFFRGLRSYMSVKSNHNSERGRPRYIFKVPKTTFDFRCPPAKIPCIPRCRISSTLPKGRFIINRKGSYPGGGRFVQPMKRGGIFFLMRREEGA